MRFASLFEFGRFHAVLCERKGDVLNLSAFLGNVISDHPQVLQYAHAF